MNARVNKYKQEIWKKFKQKKLSLKGILRLPENHLFEEHNIAIRAAKAWARKELLKEEKKAKKKRKGMSVSEAKKVPKKYANAGFCGARSSTLTGAPASPKNR